MSKALAKVWVRDTSFRDRAAIASIMSEYINNLQVKLPTKKITELLGKPNEVRNYGNDHWYYYIGSGFALDVILAKNGKQVTGTAIYILEPDDN